MNNNIYIDKATQEKILAAATVEEIAAAYHTLKKAGTGFTHKCASCSDGKVSITPAKDVFKCFSCGIGGKGGVKYVQLFENKTFPEALKICAEICHIVIPEPITSVYKKKNKQGGKKSFKDMQLYSSGLTDEDVMANIYEDDDTNLVKQMVPFKEGTEDQYKNLTAGDDMVIWYFDLDGKPVMYQKPKTSKMFPFYRMRWQFPDQHQDKTGRPMKYQSPYGSGTHIYIPEKIRKLYKNKRPIKRLFLQEGEKKAEKSCKHGIMSVGLAGIHNLSQKNGRLPDDLRRIVQECNVQEVVFVLDSDLFDLSKDLKPGDSVDKRAWSFFSAVRNYKAHFKTFLNANIYLDIYFGHILPNAAGDKGIDDYLNNSLKGSPNVLLDDINSAINEKTGEGEHVQMFKITEFSDTKILEIWDLNSAENFALRHKEVLKDIPEFKIGKHRWRFKDGQFVSAQPMEDNEQYWEEITKYDRKGDPYTIPSFDYENCYRFLKNRGFGRYLMNNDRSQFVHCDGMVVSFVTAGRIKDFVMQFTKEVSKKKIINMMYRGGKMYLGPDSMSNLDHLQLEFHRNDQNNQYLMFSENYWHITADTIKQGDIGQLQYYVWKNKVNDFKAARVKQPLLNVQELKHPESSDASKLRDFKLTFGPDAKNCDYLQFLINTSNFFHLKEKNGEQLSDHEKQENRLHLLSKFTSMGYLMHQYFDAANAKAIIGMDNKLSEIGESNGGSGKSIFGEAIGCVVSQVVIPAKNKKLTDDPHLFENVNETTDNVFLDDVRTNLDFEFFFPYITGTFMVNQKGIHRFTIAKINTPKFYMPTNHALNGEGSSFKRRQFFIAFSSYYNDLHTPIDDFGKRFFDDDWDHDDWNLFYNLAAECIQLYLRFGLIRPPMQGLELRRLRQAMGENFLTWAEEYYAENENGQGDHINKREIRRDVYKEASDKVQIPSKFFTATNFKKRLKAFCAYKGYKLNPFLFDPVTGQALNHDNDGNAKVDDKSGGVEYITVANKFFNEADPDNLPF